MNWFILKPSKIEAKRTLTFAKLNIREAKQVGFNKTKQYRSEANCLHLKFKLDNIEAKRT